MSDFKSRLIEERNELKEKTEWLLSFMETDAFTKVNEKQQLLLEEQKPFMIGYLSILNERVELLD